MTASVQRSRLVLAVVVALTFTVGFLPTAADAADTTRERRSAITIRNNAEFDAAHGVRSGSGTAEDPYVISGWEMTSLTIKDTSAHVLITDNTITSRLVLDWIGRGVAVHDNDVHDLRVNQNVPRTGDPTSGVISNNTFTVVGQLRHFDGVFESNLVGVPQEGTDRLVGEWLTRRAVNFDGFNGAQFRDNIIYGYVEVRLHGHHHSSGFGEGSHHHGGMGDDVDHASRYHEVWVTGNTITVAPGTYYALGYVDNNHAANDRTAASETNPALNDPHVHYTRVHMTGNKLVGSGLRVDIFNADDQRHLRTETGFIELENNTIVLEEPTTWPFSSASGIALYRVTDAEVSIRNNKVTGPHQHGIVHDLRYHGAGVDLGTLKNSTVWVYDNTVEHRQYGVRASSFENVTWFLDGLHTHEVDQDVYAAGAPQPQSRPAGEQPSESAPPGGEHDHDH